MNTRMQHLVFALLLALLAAAPAAAQTGGTAGAFTRLGFGARGMGMGNALTAVNHGIVSSQYNPALSAFQEGHVLYGNYGILALDRRLNHISYTQSIRLKKPGARGDDAPVSIAGVSAGWINAGDANIQGYDSDGFKTDVLSVFENQFFLNFGNRFSDRIAAGFNVKFYYSGLYEGVTSSGFGVDLGLLYTINSEFTAAFVVQDLLTKYKWDTGQLYGPERGNTTDDPFARVLRAGAAYTRRDLGLTVAADIESFDEKVFFARAGAEYAIAEQFTVRAGLDRLDLNGDGVDPRPSLGFTVAQPFGVLMPVISYAVILEPVAPTATHVLSFALSF